MASTATHGRKTHVLGTHASSPHHGRHIRFGTNRFGGGLSLTVTLAIEGVFKATSMTQETEAPVDVT